MAAALVVLALLLWMLVWLMLVVTEAGLVQQAEAAAVAAGVCGC